MASKEIEELLIKYHTEYIKDKENLYYASKGIERIRKGILQEERERDGGAIESEGNSGSRGEILSRDRDALGGKITIARKVGERFVKDGFIDIRGIKIRNYNDLAELAQIYRNPYFETMRVIYVKNNKIVAAEGVTSKLPGLTLIHKYKSNKLGGEMYVRKMEHLKADGYYLIHNHPSNDVTPSFEDEITTHRFKTGIKGFLGHLIIDHARYGYIDKNEQIFNYELSNEFLAKFDSCDNYSENIEHPLLDCKIENERDLLKIGKQLVTGDNITSIFFVTKTGIREIQEINNKVILNDKNIKNYLRNEMVRTGCQSCFFITKEKQNQNELLKKIEGLVEEKYILDCLLIEKDAHVFLSNNNNSKKEYIFAGIKECDIPCFTVREQWDNEQDNNIDNEKEYEL